MLPTFLHGQTWRSALYPEDWQPPAATASFSRDKMLQDFSYAGYKRGEQAIPHVAGPIFDVTAFGADSTGATDSTLAIQNAINAAAADGGGVVYLPAGKFLVSPQGTDNQSLKIAASNIVLRGAGTGQTFLLNTSYQMRGKSVISVSPPSISLGAARLITADLLGPTRRIPVSNAGAFGPGNLVRLEWTFTDSWILENRQETWWNATRGRPRSARYLREVVATNPEEGWIEIDIPTRYAKETLTEASVRTISGLLTHVGIEWLSIGNRQHPGSEWGDGDYADSTKPAYEVHSSALIRFQEVRDGWIRGVHSHNDANANSSTCHMLSNGIIVTGSTRVTVKDCDMRRPQYGGGGGNGYMYTIQSNELLFENCVAEYSRHGFSTSFASTSGTVFLRCVDRETKRATGSTGYVETVGSGSDNHQHFSHSNLWDQCHAHNSFWAANHRHSNGDVPHGVTSGQAVFWNTTGSGTRYAQIVRSQQLHHGYIIGTSGDQSGAAAQPLLVAARPNDPWVDPIDHTEGIGLGATLLPQSLYEDQLSRRRPTFAPAEPVNGTRLPGPAGTSDWGASVNWVGSIIADRADATAFFTANITAAQTVNLEADRTIGNIVFTDSSTSSHDLTVSGAKFLILARTTGTPVIDVTQAGRTLTISSPISGHAGLQKNGPGRLTLSGANLYTGVTRITAGVLSTPLLADGGTASGIGAADGAASNLVIDGGTLRYTGPLLGGSGFWNRALTVGANGADFDLSAATGQLRFNGVIAFSGTGPRTVTISTGTQGGRLNSALGDGNGGATSLVKNGVGTLLLTGANTYTGPLQILAGSVQYGNAGPGGESTGPGHSVAISSGASLHFRHAGDSTVAYAAAISGLGSVNMNYSNGVGGGSLTLGGDNSFSGGLTIAPSATNGIHALPLKAGSATALGIGNVSIAQYGALDLNGFSNTTGLLVGTHNDARVTNTGAADAALTLHGSGTQTFNGTIQEGAAKFALVKSGTGTQTLGGANTYTGDTTVNQGRLVLAGTGSLAFRPRRNGDSTRITIAPGASATFQGSFVIDLTDANLTSGNRWQLVKADGSATFASSFRVTDFTSAGTAGSRVWTRLDGTRTWTFTEASGELRLKNAVFAAWLAAYPTLTDTTPGGDPDGDGVANVLEFALGGDPTQPSDAARLPEEKLWPVHLAIDSSPHATLSFYRSDVSEQEVALTFQYANNLVGTNPWTDLAIGETSGGPDANGVGYTVEENADASDRITVIVPFPADSRSVFGRLRATLIP